MGCSQSSSADVATQKVEVVAPKKAFYDEYVLGKKLGAGAFAQVRIAFPQGAASSQDDSSGGFAVKIIDMRHDKVGTAPRRPGEPDNIDQRVRMDAKCEVAVWRKVSEENIPTVVLLHETYWDATCCYMVMERCDMTLLACLEHAPKMDELFLANLFQQMASACAGLHAVNVVHRDIKPDNFLVNRPAQVKLGDFGLSSIQKDGAPLTEVYGTAPFMSPEMLKEGKYGKKTDIWSVGVLYYVLLYGQFPYFAQEKSSKAMKMAIREGKMAPSFRPWKPTAESAKPSKALEDLCRSMLHRQHQSRFDAEQVMADEYWKVLRSTAQDENAASFRPMLQGAIRAGAFTVPRRNKEEQKDSTDLLLSELSRQSSRQHRRPRSDSIASHSSRSSRMSSIPPAFGVQMGRIGSSATNASSQCVTPTASKARSDFGPADAGDGVSRVSTAASGNGAAITSGSSPRAAGDHSGGMRQVHGL